MGNFLKMSQLIINKGLSKTVVLDNCLFSADFLV